MDAKGKIAFRNSLDIERCPFCKIANPYMQKIHESSTSDSEDRNPRKWRFYKCSRCGGVMTAYVKANQPEFVKEMFPAPEIVPDDLPVKAKSFLQQAIDTIHAPSGSIMLSASAVDAMLKEKGYIEGSLCSRIDKAAEDHIITEGMSKWAHQIRLDANDQRHADFEAELPKEDDAKRCIDFAKALAQFMFVLPNLVEKGLVDSELASSNDG